jgi:hypothetical protein
MPKKDTPKSTPAERSAFIREQRIRDAEGFDPTKGRFRDMSFMSKYGDVVKPSRVNPYPQTGERMDGGGWRDRLRALKFHKTYHERQARNYAKDLSAAENEGVARRNYGFIALAGILGSIFFLSSNINGNVIADLSVKTTSFLSVGCLLVGLIAGFIFLQSRK